MKKVLAVISLASLTVVLGMASIASAADGKALFEEKKCNLCHSIESQGIQKTSEKMKGAELSDAGNFVPNAEWLEKFLKQEELKDGKKHQKKWSGTDEELDTLVGWIMSLKK